MSNEQTAIRTSYFSIAGNALLAVVKGLTGYFGNSYALIADAIESSADVFASILVWWGLTYASRPPDSNHPYGHGRAETLVAFIVVAFLVGSAVVIAYNSIININTPHELPESYTLWILGVIIVWKEASYRWVIRRSKLTKSSSLRADARHHRSDAITSIAVFVGISVALILGNGYESADDWAALLVCPFILYNGYKIFRPALGEIMDEHLHEDLVTKIRTVALAVEGVIDTEKCLVRKAGMKFHVDLHAIVDGDITVKEGHEISHRLKDTLRHELPELDNVLVHVEPAHPDMK